MKSQQGIEALSGRIIDTELQIRRGMLHNPREVEAFLLHAGKVSQPMGNPGDLYIRTKKRLDLFQDLSILREISQRRRTYM